MTIDLILGDGAIQSLLEDRVRAEPNRTYCFWEDRAVTFGELDESSTRIANGLARLGVGKNDRVAVMLPNHPDHVATVFGIRKLGAVWVPINIHLKGAGLQFILDHSCPTAIIAEDAYRDALGPALAERDITIVWRSVQSGASLEAILAKESTGAKVGVFHSSDLAAIMYTSGTTGVPKGVLVSDKMLRVSAGGSAFAADLRDGDVMLMWEAINHIGGAQILFIPLLRDVKIALLERFSATQFWAQARRYGATQMHYLGGVLQILMKQPPSPDDTDNPVRVAWGGGCTSEIWSAFEERFDIVIREVYGMTESSSLTTVNAARKIGSVGTPLPYFEVGIATETGEILVRGREPGLVTDGYFRNPEATNEALPGDGWLHTGDLGTCDAGGFFAFKGRIKDSVRHRGENISAWEVERVVNEHPDVVESALVGVPSEFGEEDLKLFVKLKSDRSPNPRDLVLWCKDRMARFAVPRYVAFVDEFEKTASERIKKAALSRSRDDCWDQSCST